MMDGMFSRLRVQGFRHLHDVHLPLRPLNVLIGANGVGKTSVLEVMTLLAASASGRLQDFISAAGGLSSLVTHDRKTGLHLALTMPIKDEAPIEYELTLMQGGLAYYLNQERLIQERNAPKGSSAISSLLIRTVRTSGTSIRKPRSSCSRPGNTSATSPPWRRCRRCSGNPSNFDACWRR